MFPLGKKIDDVLEDLKLITLLCLECVLVTVSGRAPRCSKGWRIDVLISSVGLLWLKCMAPPRQVGRA